MQYTRRDWRNRNKIKTAQGVAWLTIPVRSKGKYHQRIDETEIDGDQWKRAHWRAIVSNYRKAPYFDEAAAVLEPLYQRDYVLLSDLNITFLQAINTYFDIKTPLVRSTDYDAQGIKTDRLLSLCKATGADIYVSGPSAKSYFETDKSEAAGIAVEWFDYEGYPEYTQLWGPFEHAVSIVDVMFNCGPRSRDRWQREVALTAKSETVVDQPVKRYDLG
jgi:hypothetical protein